MPQLCRDIRAAWERRADLHACGDTTAYRVFHGHSEGLPGLDIERYGDAALVRTKGELGVDLQGGVEAREIAATLSECHPFRWIGVKVQRRRSTHPAALDVAALAEPLPSRAIEVLDNGLRFSVEPFHRESTGLFLDTRPVRRWLIDNSRDQRVLNLFAYTGSLGVAAAVGGAREVVHVDLRGAMLEVARINHALNDAPCDARNFVRGNVYAHLPRASRAGQQFDRILLDPPPEMTRGRRKKRVLHQDYPKLARLCGPLLAVGGSLVCFFHRWDQTRAQYEAQIIEHAAVPLAVSHRGTSGADFPEDDPEAKMRYSVFQRV
ncbi:MAG: class I SAM-dependent methyltransferase [Planctomycetota bacterium]